MGGKEARQREGREGPPQPRDSAEGAITVLIRKATLKDTRHIDELVRGPREAGNGSGGSHYADPHPWHRTLSSILSSPEWSFYLAAEGDRKVGLLALHIRPSLSDGKKRATITDLVLADEYRGQGVERELVEEAMKTARAKGCTGLYATVDAEDRKSFELFKKLGFKQDRAFFEMELSR